MLKLTLRELFLIIALAAVLIAWRLDHVSLEANCNVTAAELAASQATVKSEQAKTATVTRKLGNLYLDACRACRAHGLSIAGQGQNAHLVENNGEDFRRSNLAEPYVSIDSSVD